LLAIFGDFVFGANIERHDGFVRILYLMENVPLNQASSDLDRLIESTVTTHQPVRIVGNHNAVLVAEQDWNAIQETLYLLSVPGMRESIHEGMNTSVEDCDQEPDW
jgi:antitoxin YefM